MLNIISSGSAKRSPVFTHGRRKRGEDNVEWLKRHVTKLEGLADSKGKAYAVLLGGRYEEHFRLRVAQGHVRSDMSPSHWSHTSLLRASGWTTGAVYEIALDPAGGFNYPPARNGVREANLSTYKSANEFPNVAVIRLPVSRTVLLRARMPFEKQRRTLDAVELILVWLAHCWGVGRTANPLLDGQGIPSASFVEVLASAAGLDLTPGLDSSASCPEAIWQSALWWHEFYGEADGVQEDRRLHGYWHAEHFLAQ